MKKKQDKKVAYVGGFRRERRRRSLEKCRQRGGPIASDGEARNPAARDAQQTDHRAGALPAPPWQSRPLWLDPSVPLPRTLYKTIPLHYVGERRTERLPHRSVQSSSTQAAPTPSTPAPGAQPQSSPAGPAPVENPIEKLDRVIHDFVASLDQETFGPGDAVLAHAERFQQLLAQSPSMKGLVLGPPVILGASPAIGLECTLGLLGSLRKTGVLRVQAGGVTFMVSIVKGDIVHGVSHPRPEPELLGNILVSRQTLDSAKLQRFFDEHGSSTSRIAEALNLQALVNTDELRDALEHQLLLLFDRLLATGDSVWCFHEGEATLAYINMRMNVISVLLESARKSDERQAI